MVLPHVLASDTTHRTHALCVEDAEALIMKFCKNLTGPCGAPTYLPTYLPYLWKTKKEITGWVKVGYYTGVMVGGTLLQPQSFL